MKKIKLILILTFIVVNYTLIIANSPAQWIAQNSGTNQNLYDVEFINENTGWALGDAGVIIKTTDGGNSWFNVPNPSLNGGGILVSIQPIDSNIVYVVGGHNIILKTTNGGDSWIEIRNGPFGAGGAFTGISFLNKDTAWFCGGNRILRTYDGGNTLDSFYTPAFSTSDIHFKDINTGLICEEGGVYKTTNGGLNWFDTNVPTGGVISFFRKLAVAENQYAWVAGTDAIFYRTTNFGDTWSRIDTIPNTGIVGIDFINADTGFAGGGSNKLFKTTDGGYNWAREQTDPGTVAFIASIKFIDNKTGWYVGGAGKIFHTTTGGQTMVNISGNNEFLPSEFMLYQNYPNPFNPATVIGYELPGVSNVRLSVYDILGSEIAVLVNEKQSAGAYKINFDASGLTGGTYFYKLSLNGNIFDVKKMILLK